MKELISHFKNENDVMFHQSVDLCKKNGGNEIDSLNMIRLGRNVYCNHHNEDEKYTDNHITGHRHSLKIIELEIGDDAIDGEISNYYDQIFDFENDNRTGEEDIYVEFSREDTQVEIYCRDTQVIDDSIKL